MLNYFCLHKCRLNLVNILDTQNNIMKFLIYGTCIHAQVDPYLKEPKKRILFEQLEQLIKAQEESIATIRASEKEVCPL